MKWPCELPWFPQGEYLVHCEIREIREMAHDGSISFVSADGKDRSSTLTSSA
jgi:hypothetical protein